MSYPCPFGAFGVIAEQLWLRDGKRGNFLFIQANELNVCVALGLMRFDLVCCERFLGLVQFLNMMIILEKYFCRPWDSSFRKNQ